MAKKKRPVKTKKTKHFLGHSVIYTRFKRSEVNRLAAAMTLILKVGNCVKRRVKRDVIFPQDVVAECVKSGYVPDEETLKRWYDYSTGYVTPDLFLCLNGLKCKSCWQQFNMILRRLFRRETYAMNNYANPSATRRATITLNLYSKPQIRMRKTDKRTELVMTLLKPPVNIDEKGHYIA